MYIQVPHKTRTIRVRKKKKKINQKTIDHSHYGIPKCDRNSASKMKPKPPRYLLLVQMKRESG